MYFWEVSDTIYRKLGAIGWDGFHGATQQPSHNINHVADWYLFCKSIRANATFKSWLEGSFAVHDARFFCEIQLFQQSI